MIERHFQIPFVGRMALAEKQIQQNYRPLIAVHKWFARRPGTLFRALLLSEYLEQPVEQTYFAGHDLSGIHILDPFMGGGTTVLEANRLGCQVTGTDINPMSWWIVRQAVLGLDLQSYSDAAMALAAYLRDEIGHLYRTTCPKTGRQAEVKYFIWVQQVKCMSCGEAHSLFPGYLIARDVRHTANVHVCGFCGALRESDTSTDSGQCPACGRAAVPAHLAARNHTTCSHCDSPMAYPTGKLPEHRLCAIEYYLPAAQRVEASKGRLFKSPDTDDLAHLAEAEERLREISPQFIPTETIPQGDETERLHRWGYERYRDLFNARQLLGLELSCRWISRHPDESIREALSTNLSDLLRYQNMLCRYDTMALKSLDVFSVHGFPVGLMPCESNLLGIAGPRGVPVGSGGWLNITEKFAKAKSYCQQPFEVRRHGTRKIEVPIVGEWIGTHSLHHGKPRQRPVHLSCGDSAQLPKTIRCDGVFTDPPYFGNVQYAELMDFCYVWLRRLVGTTHREFASPSTRSPQELTGNLNMGRDLVHFTEGMATVFSNMAQCLVPGRPLVFTYHHNKLDAYVPLAVAILDSGLNCSASLPCPAEMGASIHINGTASSVIDTVFVCRLTGRVPRRWIVGCAKDLASVVREDIDALALGELKATQGDIRCIVHGHLTRLAIWHLHAGWQRAAPATQKMDAVRLWFQAFGGVESVMGALGDHFGAAAPKQDWALEGMVRETEESPDEVPF